MLILVCVSLCMIIANRMHATPISPPIVSTVAIVIHPWPGSCSGPL